MARTPDDTNRDDLDVREREALPTTTAAAQKRAPGSTIVPELPPIPNRTAFNPQRAAGQSPTTPNSFFPHPSFSIPATPAVDTNDSSSLAASPRTPTAPYFSPAAGLSAIEESFFMNGDADTPKAVDIIRMAIRNRGDAHFLSIRNQPNDQSTIFSAITEELRDGNISEEEALSLMCEYTNSLTPDEKFGVFTDILVAKGNGSISETEAKNYAIALDLADTDKIILGDTYASLTDNLPQVFIPTLVHTKPANREIVKDGEVYSIGRLFSKKLVLAAGLALALGSIIKMGYQISKTDESTIDFSSIMLEPSTPAEAQILTREKISAVDNVDSQKQKKVAPKPIVSPAKTPVAPKIVPSVEKVEAISLPITTKPNRDGSIVIDEAKSLTSWRKLGYTIGIKNTQGGKVFVLTNKEGKKITVPTEGLKKEQTSIEIK